MSDLALEVHETITHSYSLPLAYAVITYPDEYADAQEMGMSDIEFLRSLVELGEYGALERRAKEVEALEVTYE